MSAAGLPYSSDKVFDARPLPCDGKHALIFRRWAGLAIGDHFVLLNDHRPEPLRAQFQRSLAGCFRWTEIPAPAGAYAVRIDRLHADPAGFDAAEQGCGVAGRPRTSSTGGDVLAVIEIDTRAQPMDEARARIVRIADRLSEGTELVALAASRLGGLREEFAALPFHVTCETRPDGAQQFRIRRREAPERATSPAR